jgi:hypothetical protein
MERKGSGSSNENSDQERIDVCAQTLVMVPYDAMMAVQHELERLNEAMRNLSIRAVSVFGQDDFEGFEKTTVDTTTQTETTV